MKKDLIYLANKIGINIIGFGKVRNYPELVQRYRVQEELGYKVSFQTGDINDKVFVKDKYPFYNTVIAFGVGYQLSNKLKLGKNEVYLSASSWGEDYHIVLKKYATTICDYLSNLGYKSESFVDNNSLDERYLAYQCGLGFFGKNNLLINDELGTNFFIGIILTDAYIKPDEVIKKSCMSCNKCISSCPTNALSENGLNAKKCLSYLTQKKELKEDEKKLLNNCIYGCDICSNVCPHNLAIKENVNFLPTGIEFINISEYKHLSNKEWKKKYGDLSCGWRGRNVFERNVDIAKEKLENK